MQRAEARTGVFEASQVYSSLLLAGIHSSNDIHVKRLQCTYDTDVGLLPGFIRRYASNEIVGATCLCR